MAGGGRGKGPAKGSKRKNDNQNVGQNQNVKRALTTMSDDVDHLSQQSRLNDSWSDEDPSQTQSQSDQAQCSICQKSIDVFQLNDDSLDFLC